MNDIRKHGLSFMEEATNMDVESYAVAKELIENLFFDMAKLSTKYSNNIFIDLPYTYSERRLDSVLLPAMSKLCNSLVLVELPAKRKCANYRFHVDESNGRIDYWCIYKDYSFVIELKHSFDCFTTQNTREDKVTARWIKMNEQLQSLEKEIKEYEESTKGVIRIGLHIITSYSDKMPSNHLVTQFKQSIPQTFERLQKDLGKRYPTLKPNLILCWKVPIRIIMDGEQTFPGLWAAAKVYPAVMHKGLAK